MIFLVVQILYDIVYIAHRFITNVDLGELSGIVIGYVVALPGYFALFSYGRMSNPIWSKKDDHIDPPI